MKKSPSKKPLNLATQTVRSLADNTLDKVAGGAMNNSNLTRCWVSGCSCY